MPRQVRESACCLEHLWFDVMYRGARDRMVANDFAVPDETRHASIQQTQRYLNVTDEELRRGLEVSWNNKGRPLRAVSA
jgi:hypothetical protein